VGADVRGYECGKMEKLNKRKIIIVGNPNVGKSLLFNCLTGHYVHVSNYPGTTVEISHGKMQIEKEHFEVTDTPGMYSLLTMTEDERVTRQLLFKENPSLVLHVIDAKNLNRMLHLTLQLLEADLKVCLVLNMMDEAERAGIKIDTVSLEKELGIPVVGTVSTTGRGIDQLKKCIQEYVFK